MAPVSFRHLVKRYGAIEVVKGIDLEVADGEFVVLVGPSGCGKSTTLRMLAGLESVSDGDILIGDTRVNDLAPRRRDIAMVFQDYALYPHKTVYENMAFSLKVRGIRGEDAKKRIDEAAAMLGIGPYLERRPSQLSGGQRQRVAMGRAIVRRPKVFLFDEPLSNLDAKLRGEVRTEIKKLHQDIETTIIYVTHDQVEAMTLADRIVILKGGEIEQVGTPDEVYDRPNSVFVGGFVGSPAMNFLRGRREDGAIVLPDGARLTGVGPGVGQGNGDVIVGIRPEHLFPRSDAPITINARVEVVEPLGSDTLVHAAVGDVMVTARVTPDVRPAVGEIMPLGIDAVHLRLFDARTERAIA